MMEKITRGFEYRRVFQAWLENTDLSKNRVKIDTQIISDLYRWQVEQLISPTIYDLPGTENAGDLWLTMQEPGQQYLFSRYRKADVQEALKWFHQFMFSRSRDFFWIQKQRKIEQKQALQKRQKALLRLEKRIRSNFDKKKYLGDIPVSDEEFKILCEESSCFVKTHLLSGTNQDNILLAITLIQIAAQYYNGAFWCHVGKCLRLKMTPVYQTFLSECFSYTLQRHHQTLISTSQHVQSIAFHTFVSDYYADGLFELLFAYYNKDLERDIHRNTAEQMAILMDTLQHDSELTEEELAQKLERLGGKKSQTYKLRKHTLQAIACFPTYSRVRLRRFLRLIDRYFWRNRELPANPSSRMTRLFKKWAQTSETLNRTCKLREQGVFFSRGKKHFSSPYLHADLSRGTFTLEFPAQLLPATVENPIWYISSSSGFITSFGTETFPVVSGNKTEPKSIPLPEGYLFDQFTIHLSDADEQCKRQFYIKSETARFFDAEGDHILKLEKGELSAFTDHTITLSSPALQDKVSLGALIRWDFEFENGDIVVFSDRESRIVGDRYEDGLTHRNCVEGVQCFAADGKAFSIYSVIPSLVLTLDKKKFNGTRIYINERCFSLNDLSPEEFDVSDAKGYTACLIRLQQISGIVPNSLNSVVVDLPGAVYGKAYPFGYFPGFSYSFLDAPYYNAQVGILRLTTSALLHPVESNKEDGRIESFGDGLYGFSLEQYQTCLLFDDPTGALRISINIPLFRWSTDGVHWCIRPMGDVWHRDFPNRLLIQAPCDKLEISVDADLECNEDEEDDETTSLTFYPSPQTHLFSCDLIRIRSWLAGEKSVCPVILRMNHNDFPFARILSRTLVQEENCLLTPDFETEQLTCQWPVIGGASYFIDVVYSKTGETLIEKYPYRGSSITWQLPLRNGTYILKLYEGIEDEFGFGDTEYETICTAARCIVNINDYSDWQIRLRYLQKTCFGTDRLPFAQELWVISLKKITAAQYQGILVEKDEDSVFERCGVLVEFENNRQPERFSLQWYDSDYDEYAPFTYDRNHKNLVTDHEVRNDLPQMVRYRRYLYLDERFICIGQLLDDMNEIEG